MQLLPNNWNTLLLSACVVFNDSAGQFVPNNVIPFSVTLYDPNNVPIAGATAVTIPNVAGSNGDYAKTLIIGTVETGVGQFVMTSSGAYAGAVSIVNTNLSISTRAA
jgi:hypothetical protein